MPAAAAPTPALSRITKTQVDQIINRKPIPALPRVDWPQKVYIRFGGLLTRPQMHDINQALRNAGWAVQGSSGERLAVAANLSEVRFAGDAARALAKLPETESELMRLLNLQGMVMAKGHLQQAVDAHARGNWVGANGQIRTFLDALLDTIAERISSQA